MSSQVFSSKLKSKEKENTKPSTIKSFFSCTKTPSNKLSLSKTQTEDDGIDRLVNSCDKHIEKIIIEVQSSDDITKLIEPGEQTFVDDTNDNEKCDTEVISEVEIIKDTFETKVLCLKKSFTSKLPIHPLFAKPIKSSVEVKSIIQNLTTDNSLNSEACHKSDLQHEIINLDGDAESSSVTATTMENSDIDGECNNINVENKNITEENVINNDVQDSLSSPTETVANAVFENESMNKVVDLDSNIDKDLLCHTESNATSSDKINKNSIEASSQSDSVSLQPIITLSGPESATVKPTSPIIVTLEDEIEKVEPITNFSIAPIFATTAAVATKSTAGNSDTGGRPRRQAVLNTIARGATSTTLVNIFADPEPARRKKRNIEVDAATTDTVKTSNTITTTSSVVSETTPICTATTLTNHIDNTNTNTNKTMICTAKETKILQKSNNIKKVHEIDDEGDEDEENDDDDDDEDEYVDKKIKSKKDNKHIKAKNPFFMSKTEKQRMKDEETRLKQEEEERCKIQRQLDNENRIREQFKLERERKEKERQTMFGNSINPFFNQVFVKQSSQSQSQLTDDLTQYSNAAGATQVAMVPAINIEDNAAVLFPLIHHIGLPQHNILVGTNANDKNNIRTGSNNNSNSNSNRVILNNDSCKDIINRHLTNKKFIQSSQYSDYNNSYNKNNNKNNVNQVIDMTLCDEDMPPPPPPPTTLTVTSSNDNFSYDDNNINHELDNWVSSYLNHYESILTEELTTQQHKKQQLQLNQIISENKNEESNIKSSTPPFLQQQNESLTKQYEPRTVHKTCQSQRSSVLSLVTWMNNWKVKRKATDKATRNKAKTNNHTKSNTNKTKNKKRSMYYDDDSDDYDDEYDSDEDSELNENNKNELTNVAIVVGPIGSCKTCIVEACARSVNFNLVEMNTSVDRKSNDVKSLVLEASQSRGIQSSTSNTQMSSSQTQTQTQTQTIYSQQSVSSQNSHNKTKNNSATTAANNSSNHLNLILFDEADTIIDTEDIDAGMLSAITSIARQSKCPIVLTCTTCDVFPTAFLDTLQPLVVTLQRPSITDCVNVIHEVTQSYLISYIKSSICYSQIQQSLSSNSSLPINNLEKNVLNLTENDTEINRIMENLIQVVTAQKNHNLSNSIQTYSTYITTTNNKSININEAANNNDLITKDNHHHLSFPSLWLQYANLNQLFDSDLRQILCFLQTGLPLWSQKIVQNILVKTKLISSSKIQEKCNLTDTVTDSNSNCDCDINFTNINVNNTNDHNHIVTSNDNDNANDYDKSIALIPPVIHHISPCKGLIGGGQVIRIKVSNLFQKYKVNTSKDDTTSSNDMNIHNDSDFILNNRLLQSKLCSMGYLCMEILLDDQIVIEEYVLVSDTEIALRLPDCTSTRKAGIHFITLVLYATLESNITKPTVASTHKVKSNTIDNDYTNMIDNSKYSSSIEIQKRIIQLRSDVMGRGCSWILLNESMFAPRLKLTATVTTAKKSTATVTAKGRGRLKRHKQHHENIITSSLIPLITDPITNNAAHNNIDTDDTTNKTSDNVDCNDNDDNGSCDENNDRISNTKTNLKRRITIDDDDDDDDDEEEEENHTDENINDNNEYEYDNDASTVNETVKCSRETESTFLRESLPIFNQNIVDVIFSKYSNINYSTSSINHGTYDEKQILLMNESMNNWRHYTNKSLYNNSNDINDSDDDDINNNMIQIPSADTNNNFIILPSIATSSNKINEQIQHQHELQLGSIDALNCLSEIYDNQSLADLFNNSNNYNHNISEFLNTAVNPSRSSMSLDPLCGEEIEVYHNNNDTSLCIELNHMITRSSQNLLNYKLTNYSSLNGKINKRHQQFKNSIYLFQKLDNNYQARDHYLMQKLINNMGNKNLTTLSESNDTINVFSQSQPSQVSQQDNKSVKSNTNKILTSNSNNNSNKVYGSGQGLKGRLQLTSKKVNSNNNIHDNTRRSGRLSNGNTNDDDRGLLMDVRKPKGRSRLVSMCETWMNDSDDENDKESDCNDDNNDENEKETTNIIVSTSQSTANNDITNCNTQSTSSNATEATANATKNTFKLLPSIFSTDSYVYNWRRQEFINFFYSQICFQNNVMSGVAIPTSTFNSATEIISNAAVTNSTVITAQSINVNDNMSLAESWRKRLSGSYSNCNRGTDPHLCSRIPRVVALYYLPMLGRMAQLEKEVDISRSLGYTASASVTSASEDAALYGATRRSTRRSSSAYASSSGDDHYAQTMVKYKHMTACTGMSEENIEKLLDYGFIGSHVRSNIKPNYSD